MEEDKKRLINSILHFLRSEFRSGQLNSESQEGLEVAIQCLESVYDIKETTQTEPTLLEIYKAYLVPTIIQRPDVSEEDKKEAEKLKVEGNTAMTQGDFYKALDLYTRAIQMDPKNAVYYCNRAAAYSKVQNHTAAIVDCKIALEIDPKYSKAYGRLGLAYCGLENYVSALENYKKAVELEPTNEGYVKNYELALEKVSNPSAPTVTESTSSFRATRPQPELSADMSVLFGNSQLLNIASQMLSDPNMQNMMSNLLVNGLGQENSSMEQIINVGQRLAQHMNTENPQFVSELRAALNRSTGPMDQQGSPQEPSATPRDNTNEDLPSSHPDEDCGDNQSPK